MKIEGWNHYLCNMNDQIASVYLNLDLKDFPLKEEFSELNWYWIKLKKPREDGLSSNDEFDCLVDHEAKLIKYLDCDNIIFAGRITTQGRRQFYFYSTPDFDFTDEIEKFTGLNPGYLYQVGQKQDPEWNHYINTLYPYENGIQQIIEREMINE